MRELDLRELLDMHDKAYNRGMITRERASDDLVFYWVTQWDDNLLGESQLQYRGEFNIVRKAGRQIMADLAANPIQVDFEPLPGTPDDASDLADGLYRTGMRANKSQEAKMIGQTEAIVCGVGAWELVNTYRTNQDGDLEQVIERSPLPEANNNVYWDPNALLIDKSDANYCSCLIPYSKAGYNRLVYELTGEERDEDYPVSFKYPEISYAFPWLGGQDERYYVARFFYRQKVKVTTLVFEDMFGESEEFDEEDFDSDDEERMLNGGFQLVSEKTTERFIVTRYIASGEGIFETTIVPGECIPVIPEYGERAFIEGEEHYEGITRIAKDPQRLRNFQLSYLADIVSRSPRQKPIFYQEQVQGHEDMYDETGSDNHYPYLLQNRLDAEGNELPGGPAGIMPEQPIPQALMVSIDESRKAVEDVANPGLPQDVTDPDMSGKAVLALQSRLDMQTFIYQENHKYAMRRDGEVWASMAKDIFDTEREEILTSVDGSQKKATLLKESFDPDTFERVVENEFPAYAFNVYAEVGPAFQSLKAQNREELKQLINSLDPNDPKRNILLNEYLTLIDGVNFRDIRDYARRELILAGVKEPETEEEQQMVAAASQAQDQPDAAMLLALAEMEKAKADQMREQNKQIELQIKAAEYNLKEGGLVLDTEKAVAEIRNKNANTTKTIAEAQNISQESIRNMLANIQPFGPQQT